MKNIRFNLRKFSREITTVIIQIIISSDYRRLFKQMDYDHLLVLLVFVFLTITLFWLMSKRKSKILVKRLSKLLKIVSINDIFQLIQLILKMNL